MLAYIPAPWIRHGLWNILNHPEILWLVVYLPLWKIWVRQLGWWHSQLNGNIIQMFQTTNQQFSVVWVIHGWRIMKHIETSQNSHCFHSIFPTHCRAPLKHRRPDAAETGEATDGVVRPQGDPKGAWHRKTIGKPIGKWENHRKT